VGSKGVVAEPVPLHDSLLWFVKMDNGKNAVYHEGELEISGEPVKKKSIIIVHYRSLNQRRRFGLSMAQYRANCRKLQEGFNILKQMH